MSIWLAVGLHKINDFGFLPALKYSWIWVKVPMSLTHSPDPEFEK